MSDALVMMKKKMRCFHYYSPSNRNRGEEKTIQALLDETSLSKQKPI
jgi:hypothetical protein